MQKAGAYMKGDERILGNSDFVESILAQAGEDLERKYRLGAEGYDFYKVVDHVEHLMGLKRDEVPSPGKYKKWWRLVVSYVIGPCASLASAKVFWRKSFGSSRVVNRFKRAGIQFSQPSGNTQTYSIHINGPCGVSPLSGKRVRRYGSILNNIIEVKSWESILLCVL